jgi:hypothetical protein
MNILEEVLQSDSESSDDEEEVSRNNVKKPMKPAMATLPKREYLNPAQLYKEKYQKDTLKEHPELAEMTFQTIKNKHSDLVDCDAIIREFKACDNEYKKKYEEWKAENGEVAEEYERSKAETQRHRKERKHKNKKFAINGIEIDDTDGAEKIELKRQIQEGLAALNVLCTRMERFFADGAENRKKRQRLVEKLI